MRSYQMEVFKYVIQRIESKDKRILIELPVGSGKSMIIMKIISYLLSNKYDNIIGLFFPGKLLVNYFKETLNDALSEFPIDYEYQKNSIKLNLRDSSTRNQPPIYFIDDCLNSEVNNVIKIKDAIIIGFYVNTSIEILKKFGKTHPDYLINASDLIIKFNLKALQENPLPFLHGILNKLSIKNDSGDLTKNLISLNLWVYEYLKVKNENDNEKYDKSDLIETFVERSNAIDVFKKLLHNEKYFASIQKQGNKESVWQNFLRL